MTRGNQRELARKRNEKKQPKAKATSDISHTKRKEIDAEIMRQKQLKKAAEAK
ncbi:hypothetical protein GGH12_004882 [Coemansia sp. RSA 1822]|nr:hypothetical protein LPJ76_003220 [Coemansia sp. RSA 638]KAJ2120770.1 hypothetical protein IW147_004791 [Coemansia sp. RSA 720]KAJ2476287.1 hypothetical protein IWW56_005005 [Coemansia sp. RSA 2131]KAJ2541065.1 hypothetical protein GGF49_003984 [Coemansia sp. RSA 1853]KAJ2560355.1 hypothetical protein GGH12_004882 [Coemansia sp. RSA 1822]KAJ2658937.1 hypothetical protein IW148_004487 [Coemansia sp. RSA 1199]